MTIIPPILREVAVSRSHRDEEVAGGSDGRPRKLMGELSKHGKFAVAAIEIPHFPRIVSTQRGGSNLFIERTAYLVTSKARHCPPGDRDGVGP